MNKDAHQQLIDTLNEAAQPIDVKQNQYADLMKNIGDARFVLIGEASHGTHEFYQARIDITRQLIQEKGFMAVAVEGDWPDSYSINRYIKGMGKKEDTAHALANFTRFPLWMWRNTTIPPFIEWLRNYNDKLAVSTSKIGFYGLDLYSLHSSMAAVINYLTKVDPDAALRARLRFECFDHMAIDPQSYGYLTSAGIKKHCIRETIEQMLDMQHHAFQYVKQDGMAAEDEYFYALQNARVVKDAEEYYRSMFEGHVT